MRPDSVRIDETKAWLVRANDDIRAARHDFKAEPPLLRDVVFHAQQAAEKSLKAFLSWHDVPFRKTHNLEELGEQCLAIKPLLRVAVDQAVPLTEYAWQYRYPGDPFEPDQHEAKDAVDRADAVLTAVLDQLPPEVAP